MKLFWCQKCSNRLYFENTSCEKCGSMLGYLPEREVLSAVVPEGPVWAALADPDQHYRFCANWEAQVCNWMVMSGGDSPYCTACQHNRFVPDIGDATNRALWRKLEEAKRRLFYSLIKLRLPTPLPAANDPEPLVFEFLSERTGEHVMTGHASGKITISLSEADDAVREKLRTQMHEPYRTLLGHFRHEVGHFYWDRLVRDTPQLEAFRGTFGDERLPYEAALAKHYAEGPKPDWQESFVSAYATAHPWEDFAETWAHYLHIVDALEMAQAFGLRVDPAVTRQVGAAPVNVGNPYHASRMEAVMTEWLPITFAVNSLNRTMGQPDLYPFVVAPPVVQKLDFIRRLAQGSAVPG